MLTEPWKHISQLHGQWHESTAEAEGLRSRLAELEQLHKADLEGALNALKLDMENKAKDQAEVIKLERK